MIKNVINLSILEILPVLTYLLFLLWIGLRHRQDSSDAADFMLGGRRLTLPAFVATLVSTWYGGILGVGEFTYLYGLSNWLVFGVPYYFFALIFAWLLARPIHQAGNISIPELLQHPQNSWSRKVAAIYVLFMTLPAPYVLMVGFFLQVISGFPLWICIISGAVISMLYVLSGGFRAVVRTDKLQFILMFGGFLILTAVLLMRYGLPVLQTELPDTHLEWTGGNSAGYILSWFLIAAWTFVDPGFHQRCAAAGSPAIARRGIVVSVVFWFFFDVMTTLCGLYAVVLLPDITPQLSFPLLGHQELPPLISGLFLTGLLATIMSTVDSLMLLSAMTIGYDLSKKPLSETHTIGLRKSLVISVVLSVLLAILLPSVIQLWFTIGNLFIPPLLLPVINRLLKVWPLDARWTLVHLLSVFAVTLGCWILAVVNSGDLQNPQYILGLQPMFPGLVTSGLVYFLSRTRKGFTSKTP